MTALANLHLTVVEDLLFSLSGGEGSDAEALVGILGRRLKHHQKARTEAVSRMGSDFEPWLFALARAAAPIAPPSWLPMGDVLREKVTLEVGARGLRSLFSSTPSDKEKERVRKIGGFAARVLRGTFAADGEISAEETRAIRTFVGALGLPEADEKSILEEPVFPVETLDVVGEIEPKVLRAILFGGWLASAWDTIDPREETYLRTLANRLTIATAEVETLRTKAIALVDSRKALGNAAVEGIRHVLLGALGGDTGAIAKSLATLMLPLKYREEVLGPLLHGAEVKLDKRHRSIAKNERLTALDIVWATALTTNPTAADRLALAARHDELGADIDEDAKKSRTRVEDLVEKATMDALAKD